MIATHDRTGPRLTTAELPPVSLLRAFDAAGRHASFKEAAAFLNVTPSTISHQIAHLERYLGVQLFERGTPKIRLTTAGAELLEDVSAAFSRMRQATGRIRRLGQPVTVRISANPFLAAEVLVPSIESFDRSFPKQTIHISATEEMQDPRDGGIDFCVRFGDGEWPGLDVTALYPVHAVAVAATTSSASPLARIDYPYRGQSVWQTWELRGGPALTSSELIRHFSNFAAAMRAAEQGVGIAIAVWPVVQPLLQARRLTRVGTAALSLGHLYLLSRHLNPSQTQLLAAREWLTKVLRQAAHAPDEPG